MASLKNIVDLPVAESAEGLNLIVNDNGAAKQIAASAVSKVKSVNGIEPDEGGNVQIDTASSWNDLKDKPFGDGEEVTILERNTYDEFFNPEADFNVIENLPSLDVVEGDIVKVFWDGEVYSCQVGRHDGYTVYFGNPRLQTGNDNQLPFTFLRTETQGWAAVAYGDLSVTSHTFGVTKVGVKKLDAKYLPDDVCGGWDIIFSQDGYSGAVILENGTYAKIYDKFIAKKLISCVFYKYVDDSMLFENSVRVRLDHMFGFNCIVFSFNNPYELLITTENEALMNTLD